jgi:HSP20 family molecular chaperone IbpA
MLFTYKFNTVEINNLFKDFEDVKTYKADTNGELTVPLDVPGFKKNELTINFDRTKTGNFLTIKGKNSSRTYDNKILISELYDEKNIKATLEDGVLNIKLKIKEKQETGSKIEID